MTVIKRRLCRLKRADELFSSITGVKIPQKKNHRLQTATLMALTEPNGKLDLLSQCVCARLCVCECVHVAAADTVKDGASWHHCFHRKWCFQNSAFPLCSSPRTRRVCPRHHSESASSVWSRSPEAKLYHLTIKEKSWLLAGQIIFLLSRSPLKIHHGRVVLRFVAAEYLSGCEKLPGGTEQDGYLILRKRDEESREEGEESGGKWRRSFWSDDNYRHTKNTSTSPSSSTPCL